MRGDGFVFQRGRRWWIGYYKDRKFYREAVGTTKTAAKERLKEVHRQILGGAFLTPQERRVTVDDLLDDLVIHLEVKGAASAAKVKSHLKAVRRELGHIRAVDLNTPAMERYQLSRLSAGRKPATVNRECEAVRQAFRMASRRTPPRVTSVPYIPMLKVENARQGFLSRTEIEAILANLTDPDVCDFVEWFWWTGMRPNEIRQLTWPMFDRETWSLALDPRAAKTRKGRVIPCEGPLLVIMQRRLQARRLDCPLIFHRVSKGKRGQPVKDFSKQWKQALRAADLPSTLIPYDLRRSALRNMVRGGTDFSVAMKLSGHRTRSTFDRYNITDEQDLRTAVARTAQYVEKLPSERKVLSFDHRTLTKRSQSARSRKG